ncbi:1,3-beta-glucanosyltransferase Gel1 [Talaromyces proteolyticus]|uniref:1,3-beta-glucanosyltransferase n=1 Tax=Talaromyces proteolyticus TaxID=1131652 RepID=A0AAD4KKF3_9EURO|nr:1,3-beta-glucanosyltransferase Gel1 [Talaromyces proteolyticus]KAH8694863.1 1,3-beta-glucanosyltransferase Gel1 [Talaromyces proteolyticus]
MKAILASLAAASLAAAAPQHLQARDSPVPITTKGNAFFQGDNRFYIRGVDYQPGGSSKLVDPLADASTCKRDIQKFTDLGLNTVRVYSVDNSADHDDCMNALADANIYVVLDVNTPKYSLNRADPETSYNDVYLQNVFATVEMFAKYPNTLAFFSGNEVINDGPSSKAAPYVKAVTRDIRQFLRLRNLRSVPVGYSAADVDTNRLQMAEYMNCGTDDERSDFFAFNDYSWCDPSSFTISGWDQKVKNFTGYGLPLFLSEYGCNTNKRQFQEVSSLYSTQMTAVYSGGLVYEYSEEGSNYGLVNIDGDSVTEKDDYTELKNALEKTPPPKGDGGYNSTGGASGCPASDPPNWDVSNDALPAIPAPAKKFMSEGAGKGPGFVGSGSQNKGTASSSTATPGSGSATGAAATSTSTSSKGAAAGLRAPEMTFAPLFCSVIVALSTLFGASFVFL